MGNSQHGTVRFWTDLIRRNFAAHKSAGQLHGLDDFLVTGTAAEVTAQRRLDFLDPGLRIDIQKRLGCHDHARRAIATLNGSRKDKGLLDQVRVLRSTQALYGDNFGPVQIGDFGEAGANRFLIDDHGAGAALPFSVTGLLCADQAEILAQQV